MASIGAVGPVSDLWRFPVKSMSGERLNEAVLTSQGILGDRAFAIVDEQTGKVASAKSVRLFPDLLQCKAAFVEPPHPGQELPSVRITLSDGSTVSSDSAQVDRVLSDHFRRDVKLARAAPDDYTIDMFQPDIEGFASADQRGTVVEQKLGSAYFDATGIASAVPAGAFFDLYPVSVLTTSTLERLGELEPRSRFDVRRFRMNVIVGTRGAGFPENDWIGREVAIGDSARLQVAVPDSRCVMTTLAQDELPNDLEVLRALVRHNRIQVRTDGLKPCAGVYAVVGAPGSLRTGDPVVVV